MNTVKKTWSVVFGILLACLLSGSCAYNQAYIQTKDAPNSEITGSYTVFLYGANHYNDIATVAIMAPTDGLYTFDIYAPDWAFRTVKGVPGKDAVAVAESFVSWHSSVIRTQTAKILASDGKVIGYEIRPLYMSTTFGREDVMYIDYLLKDNNHIEVHVHLDPYIEKSFVTGDGKNDNDN
jgi:hypothetical protein